MSAQVLRVSYTDETIFISARLRAVAITLPFTANISIHTSFVQSACSSAPRLLELLLQLSHNGSSQASRSMNPCLKCITHLRGARCSFSILVSSSTSATVPGKTLDANGLVRMFSSPRKDTKSIGIIAGRQYTIHRIWGMLGESSAQGRKPLAVKVRESESISID